MIRLNQVSKQYGSKILFENASAFIGQTSRIALVGPNGAGKSTLIKLILNQEFPDSGSITKSKFLSIGHLAQEVPNSTGQTVLSETMRLDGRREALLLEKQTLEEQFTQTAASESDLKRYGRITEELEHNNEYRLESRAKEILSGLGFKTEHFDRALNEFSGGWLMRVALARVLLMDPDLLLLDEPTNHLDLESVLWLEDFLKEYHGAILLVSHDKKFLNEIVSEVLEIDGKNLVKYTGNIDSFIQQKEERLEILRAQYQGQQAKIDEVMAWVNRFGAKATKARQAQSKLKQLEKMDKIELAEERSSIRFRFPPAPRSGNEVITSKNLILKYGEKTIFQNLNWILQRGSRVAIVGQNGAGKTTLLKLLSGELKSTSGSLIHGHAVNVGYYAQHQAESLDLNKTIFEELESSFPNVDHPVIRSIAGAFLFSGDAIHKKCSVLSGGEKARVALAKLLLKPCNFLLLDEPTNHLDVDSRAVLSEALQSFDGTICLVSHDREFMEPLVTSVIEIATSNDGTHSTATPLPWNYDEYLIRKTKEIRSLRQDQKKPKQDSKKDENSKVKSGISHNQKRSWERESEKLEKEIAELEQKQAQTASELSDPKTYEDREKAIKLSEQQKETQMQINAKLSRWEELSLLLEQIGKS